MHPTAIPTRRRPPHSMPAKTALMTAAAACLLLAAPSGFGRGTGLSQGPPWFAQAAVDDSTALAGGDPVGVIEAQVRQLLADGQRQQLQLALLRQRLVAAESASASLPLLALGLVALVGLVGLAGGLALRVRRLQRLLRLQTRRAEVLADAQAEALADAGAGAASGPQSMTSGGTPLFGPQSAMPAVAVTAPGATLAGLATAAAAARLAAAPLPRAADAISAASHPHGALSLGTGVPPRPVSVEELLDLDQQVDFFIALGQEQSAVDLLLSHVRATGGANALPYLRLLQIYRQQGDEEAFERTRDRFNQRFNAQAPDWHGDLAAGRCLEHYTDVMLRLQHAWPQPLRAAAELESLLLRRADLEPFDLPAFHDILTLHALVCDLPAMPLAPPLPAPVPSPVPSSVPPPASLAAPDRVDVLLPLGEAPPDIISPRPRMAESGSVARAMLADWVFSRASIGLSVAGSEGSDPTPADRSRALTRLDLDLTDYGPAPREFTRPAAFTDVDIRRDSRLSDLAAFDDSDLLPPVTTRR